jgi:DNA-binding XRE family transcriptional regulator
VNFCIPFGLSQETHGIHHFFSLLFLSRKGIALNAQSLIPLGVHLGCGLDSVMRVSRSNEMTRKKFTKLLKNYRERRRFTQEDAAKHLGVSVRTLQNWEIARNMPRGFGLRALLKVISPR